MLVRRRIQCRGRAARIAVLAAATSMASCDLPQRPQGRAWRLVEKGPYQALYDANGRLERLLHDADGDGRAETVVFFGAHGKPARSERDTNGDGAVDRWESFVSESVWVAMLDTDGDGRADHRELHGPDGVVSLPLEE